MKTRLITAAIGIALLLIVLLIPGTLPVTLLCMVVCGLSAYEIVLADGLGNNRGIVTAAVLFAALAPLFNHLSATAVFCICLLYVLALVLLMVIYHDTVSPERLSLVFLMTVVVSVGLSCMAYLRCLGVERDSDGLFYVVLALVISWMSDTGAYFIGTFFGKRKLCPRISPKKTVEGLFGGIGVSLLSSLFTGFVYQNWILHGAVRVSYVHIFALAVVCAPLSVIGDLFASLIKRHCGVKDFGNLFPGHGGVLDRFDSLMFVFPVLFFTVSSFPLLY